MAEDRQIHAMIEFIERDAQEKAREFDDEAQALYDAEKAALVEQQKKKVINDFTEAQKKAEIAHRVTRAQLSKDERLRINDCRLSKLDQLKQDAEKKIRAMVSAGGAPYKKLLKDLLIQSAVGIECDATVVVRKQDEAEVKGLLKDAEAAVKKARGKTVTLTIAKENLTDADWGGMTLHSTDGKITNQNTLAYRMATVFTEQIPTLRHALFHPLGNQ